MPFTCSQIVTAIVQDVCTPDTGALAPGVFPPALQPPSVTILDWNSQLGSLTLCPACPSGAGDPVFNSIFPVFTAATQSWYPAGSDGVSVWPPYNIGGKRSDTGGLFGLFWFPPGFAGPNAVWCLSIACELNNSVWVGIKTVGADPIGTYIRDTTNLLGVVCSGAPGCYHVTGPGKIMWFQASQFITVVPNGSLATGLGVSTWTDQSGNANNAQQPNLGLQFTYYQIGTRKGKTAVVNPTDGGSGYNAVMASPLSLNPPFTFIFCAGRTQTLNTRQNYLLALRACAPVAIFGSHNLGFLDPWGGAIVADSGVSIQFGDFKLHIYGAMVPASYLVDGITFFFADIAVGSAVSYVNVIPANPIGTSGVNTICYGPGVPPDIHGPAGGSFSGDIAEIIAYDTVAGKGQIEAEIKRMQTIYDNGVNP